MTFKVGKMAKLHFYCAGIAERAQKLQLPAALGPRRYLSPNLDRLARDLCRLKLAFILNSKSAIPMK
jgi:hypothetical protein